MPEAFKLKIEGFEGPLDLLLSLIEKRKLPINDVSLAQVTDEYIAHIEKEHEFPMSQTASFILIASTLLLIKSKSLLPLFELSEEEESNIKDLELRLKLYKQIKELTPLIQKKFGEQFLFEPSKQQSRDIVFSPPKDASVTAIATAIRSVLISLPKVEKVPQAIVKKIVSLEETIENLTKRITKSARMSFSEFSNLGKGEKVEIIVSFLAMLELVKQGIINVTQERTFTDITMESDVVSIPSYE